MESVKTHLRGSKKYVLMSLEDFNDFMKRFRIQNYTHITRRIYNKSNNKEAINNAVNGAIRDFRHAHPGVLPGHWQQSLVKRIGGCVYSWLYINEKLKDIENIKSVERLSK